MTDTDPEAISTCEMWRKAYESLEFEMVEVHENLEVPSSSTALFSYRDSPGVTDADEIAEYLADYESMSFIDVLAENGEAWYEFSVSGSLWDDNRNQRLMVAISTAGVRFNRKREVSFETFAKAVRATELAVDGVLEYEP